MRYLLAALAVIFLASAANCEPLKSLPPLPHDDILLNALGDELHRSIERLRLDTTHSGPYFIAYDVRQTDRLDITASFGAIDACKKDISRHLDVDVRVGDYNLDSLTSNSVNMGSLVITTANRPWCALTTDNNYDSIRHDVWLKTDQAYKKAIEDLAHKKAFLAEHKVKDRPESMSHEEPVVSIEPAARLDINERQAQNLSRDLSAIFRDYPKIEMSTVSLNANAITRWFINNEGFCNRTATKQCVVIVQAAGRAEDGTSVCDAEYFVGENLAALPPYAEMAKKVRDLAERLTTVTSAKSLEQYRGPILFEGQAAAEFMSQILQPHLGHAPEPLRVETATSAMFKNPLDERLGTRILPKFISVVDDPLTGPVGGIKMPSTYAIDDDGLRAQKIILVDKGILKTFAMSRAPSHEIKQSNGHAQGIAGVASNIHILAAEKLTLPQLHEKLCTLGKEEGLDEVLIARRLNGLVAASLDPMMMMNAFNPSGVSLLPPLLLYRLSLSDGTEEAVRASRFSNLSMRILRDIDAAGDDERLYPIITLHWLGHLGASTGVNTITTPSLLVSEAEFLKPPKQNTLPPILKSPFFEK